MKKYIYFTIGILVIFTLSSCKSKIAKINTIQKKIVYPGKQGEKITINYSANIKVLKEFKIDGITLVSNSEKIPIDKFSIIELPNGKIMQKTQKLPVGEYFFETSITFQDRFEKSIDYFNFIMSLSNEKKVKINHVLVEKSIIERHK